MVVESVKSSTFRFRTRTGEFATKMDDPRTAEKCLALRLREVREEQSAHMGASSFQRNYPTDVFKHGQNGAVDPSVFSAECEKVAT